MNKPSAKSEKRYHLDKRAEEVAAAPGGDDDLLNTNETAVWLGVSTQFLEIARSKGEGPPFVVLGPRAVRYMRSQVREWLYQRAHRGTAEYIDRPAPKKRRAA